MANQISFSNKSIINLLTDTVKVSYETVERNGESLSLIGRARCGFEYNFDTSGNSLSCEHLQLSLDVNSSDINDNTRYSENVVVLINVQYYEEVLDGSGVVIDYTDGNIDTFKLYPYLLHETDGYNNLYTLDLEDRLVKSIYVEFINLGDTDVTFRNVSLSYSLTVSQSVAETVGFDISLLGVTWHPNGFEIAYSGNDNTDKFYWNADENDELNGINVNGVKLIYMRNSSELLE